MASNLRSGRNSCCTRRASPIAKSVSRCRSWNSSKMTADTPSSDGSSCTCRRKIPSVRITDSSLLARLAIEANLVSNQPAERRLLFPSPLAPQNFARPADAVQAPESSRQSLVLADADKERVLRAGFSQPPAEQPPRRSPPSQPLAQLHRDVHLSATLASQHVSGPKRLNRRIASFLRCGSTHACMHKICRDRGVHVQLLSRLF